MSAKYQSINAAYPRYDKLMMNSSLGYAYNTASIGNTGVVFMMDCHWLISAYLLSAKSCRVQKYLRRNGFVIEAKTAILCIISI